MYKAVFVRFFKGAIAGAVTAMGMVTLVQPTAWAEFSSIFSSFGIAGLF